MTKPGQKHDGEEGIDFNGIEFGELAAMFMVDLVLPREIIRWGVNGLRT